MLKLNKLGRPTVSQIDVQAGEPWLLHTVEESTVLCEATSPCRADIAHAQSCAVVDGASDGEPQQALQVEMHVCALRRDVMT